MSKVSLAQQIEAVALACRFDDASAGFTVAMKAALATLTMLEKYESEVRDLLSLCIKRDEELPGSRIEVRE